MNRRGYSMTMGGNIGLLVTLMILVVGISAVFLMGHGVTQSMTNASSPEVGFYANVTGVVGGVMAAFYPVGLIVVMFAVMMALWAGFRMR